MRRAAAIYTRIREELVRRQEEIEDAHLSALTIVVKIDRKTGLPGALLWRPEYETIFPGPGRPPPEARPPGGQ